MYEELWKWVGAAAEGVADFDAGELLGTFLILAGIFVVPGISLSPGNEN